MIYDGQARNPLLPGEKITIGEQEFILPRMKMRQFRANLERFESDAPSTRKGVMTDNMDALIENIAESLKSNYPEITKEHLLEAPFDTALLRHLNEAFNKVNGLDKGEAAAPESGAESTGMNPTPLLPHQPAGHHHR